MRVESDRQGHHSSEAPACHRCGIPLLADATFCPYCEQWLDESTGRTGGSLAALIGRLVGDRTRLTLGLVFFAVVAVICVIAALLI